MITPAIRPAIGPAIRSAFDGGFAPSLLSQAMRITRTYGGALYAPSVLSSLYQDAAGTLPVTAPGQPVGLMRDLSGNGHHVSQTTTTARPLYQIIGGFPCVVGDGVDDFLRTPVQIPAGPDRSTTLMVAARLLSESGDYKHVMGAGNTTPLRAAQIQRLTVAGNSWAGQVNYGGSPNYPVAAPPWPVGATSVLYFVAQPDVPRHQLFINNVSRALTTGNVGSNPNGPMTLVLLGSRTGGNPPNSAIFASAYVPVALTPEERLTLTLWLASISGVTL